MAEGKFREDLFYRLNVFAIDVPPLRRRKEDLPQSIDHFVRLFSRELGKRVASISPETLRVLQQHDWPGNVRELQSAVKYALAGSSSTFHQSHDQLGRRGDEMNLQGRTQPEHDPQRDQKGGRLRKCRRAPAAAGSPTPICPDPQKQRQRRLRSCAGRLLSIIHPSSRLRRRPSSIPTCRRCVLVLRRITRENPSRRCPAGCVIIVAHFDGKHGKAPAGCSELDIKLGL